MIDLIDVSKSYGKGLPAVNHVNLHVDKGEFVFVVGSSGSGKSTLIQHLNGLLKPTSGRILLQGRDIWADPKKIRDVRFQVGLVFQYPEYQLFEETVYKDIAFGPKNMGLDEADIDRRVRDAAAFVGLTEAMLDKSPFELSGGQKRRVAIAGVIAMEPKVLVLDEPTAGEKRLCGAGEPQHGGDRPQCGPHRGPVGQPCVHGGHAPSGVRPRR